MKKIFISLMLSAFLTGIAQAQYQPEDSKFSLELQFAPFGERPFSDMGIRGRYFFNEKLALRLNFDFYAQNTDYSNPIDDNYTGLQRKGKTTATSSVSSFEIAPGVEYHFLTWERLSVYVGGEIGYGMTFAKSHFNENYQAKEYIWDGYFEHYRDYTYNKTVDVSGATGVNDCYNCDPYMGNRNATIFGAALVTGFDFYIYRGLYMGAELGLGYTYTSVGKVKVTTDIQDSRATENYHEEKTYRDKSTMGVFDISCEPRIRIGWRF